MGKKNKIRNGSGDVVPHPGPLDKQIEGSRTAKKKFKPNKRLKEDFENQKTIHSRLSSTILREAQKQQQEISNENDDSTGEPREIPCGRTSLKSVSFEMEEMENDSTEDITPSFTHGIYEKFNQLDPDGQNLFDEFRMIEMPELVEKKTNVSDLIKNKIDGKYVSFNEQISPQLESDEFDPKIAQLYQDVGHFLSKYKSGKIPKAFKIIPTLPQWEMALQLTSPKNWTPAVLLYATRIFSSCSTPSVCQRFFNTILLPRVRLEIEDLKRLNHHLHESVFKALFKPAAFFKGLLLPLCKSETFTMREAVIIGSVLRKASIPPLHAAAAILNLSLIKYSGPSGYILSVFLKKYSSFPIRVIDALVIYFMGMKEHENLLPVIWHQTLLCFVENHINDLNPQQKADILNLTKARFHDKISPDVINIIRNGPSDKKKAVNRKVNFDSMNMEEDIVY